MSDADLIKELRSMGEFMEDAVTGSKDKSPWWRAADRIEALLGTSDIPLAPCPFCDSPDVRVAGNGGMSYVGCNQCGAEGPYVPNRTRAKEEWNRRATHPAKEG